jgi:hypothetical protein
LSGDEKFAARWRAGNFLVIARRWMEPQCSAATTFLRINDPSAPGLGTPRLGRCASRGAFSFLRSAVGPIAKPFRATIKCLQS